MTMLQQNPASWCCLPPSPASTPTTHSKKRKTASSSPRVGFSSSNTIVYIESALELTQDDRNCRWYQVAELQDIKSLARRLCVQESKNSSSTEEKTDSTRGMDVYYPSRQRNQKKFVEHVLEAYHFRCAGNSEHVRQLVERWSAKSKQRAATRGKQDFVDAFC
ncbi:MAG: hypothetical protein SGILL_003110 [Bacillariaceae sp.]